MFDPAAYAMLELQRRERFYRTGLLVSGALTVVLLFAVFLLSASVARLKQEHHRDWPDDMAAIRTVLDEQVAAWNKGDLDGFMAGYWKDDKLSFTSNGAITQGWEATRERYQKRYFTPNAEGKLAERGELSFDELHFEGFGPDGAMVRGKFILKLEKETATGRFTLGFRRLADGWRIISDHTSVDCPPAEKKEKKRE
jgi:beta-aspartyl-peptidase (threonine type)